VPHVQKLSNFFERVALAVLESKSHLDDLLLALRQCGKYRLHLLLEQLIGGRLFWRSAIFILDKITEHRILVLAITPNARVEA